MTDHPPMALGPVDYRSVEAPAGYRCSACGAHGCKLWRQYQTLADHVHLLCALCAGNDQQVDVSSMDAAGRWDMPEFGRTDAISWLVPAVPTEDGETYWGYTSVPEEGVDWWRRLPSLP